jgi:hypothetical protein
VIRHSIVALIGSVLVAGCVSGEEVESSGSSIVGGQVEPGYEAVGSLITDIGGCTATLVSPNVVVSAKHCIGGPGTDPGAVSFRTGVNGENVAGVGVQLYSVGSFEFQPDGELPQDFLVVRLDRNVDIAPMGFRRSAMGDGEVGRGVMHVGYGFTSAQGNDYGTRRSGGGTISLVDGDTFNTARNGAATVCFGDSGGPVFLDGEVAGIANGTFQPACTENAVHARVDNYTALLDQAIADGGGNPGGDDPGGDDPGGDDPGGDDPGGDDPGGDDPGGDDPGGDDPGGDDPGGDDPGDDPGPWGGDDDGDVSCPGGGGEDAGLYYDQNPGCDSDGDLIIGLADREHGFGGDCDPESVNLCMESHQSCLDGIEHEQYGCEPWRRLCSLRGEGANGELCQ